MAIILVVNNKKIVNGWFDNNQTFPVDIQLIKTSL